MGPDVPLWVAFDFPRCRFCSAEAIARVGLDGCFCYPNDRVQDLCLHHYIRATPLGAMWLVQDYSRGEAFSKALAAGLI